MTKIFRKVRKTLFRCHFGSFLPKFGQIRIFLEKKALLTFKYSNYLPSRKKSEKANAPFLRKECLTEGRTDRQMTDRQTDRQTTVIFWDPSQDGGPISSNSFKMLESYSTKLFLFGNPKFMKSTNSFVLNYQFSSINQKI